MSDRDRQHTVGKPVKVKGVGVHTDAKVTLTIRPADEGHGIVFRRVDLDGEPTIPARAESIVWDKLGNRTTLGQGAAQVQTAEHVLSALLAMGVDNALLDLNGIECPACDNSAMPFVEAIDEAGVVAQSAVRDVITLMDAVTVRDEKSGAEVTAIPSERFEITFFAEFPPDYFLPPQTVHMIVNPRNFRERIASARTWIFAEMIPDLLLRGLGQGGTRDTVLVIGKSEFVTEPRMPDEAARHKAVDLIGDLALLGRRINAHVLARRSGHALHAKLVRRILDTVG